MKISWIFFITLSFLLSSCLKVPSKVEPGFLGGIELSLSNSTISSSATTLQSGESVTITLSLKDQFGQAYFVPNSSPVVVFSISGGTSNGTFGPVTDFKNGTFTTSFTGTSAGSPITVSATVDDQALISPLPSLTVTQGQSSNISIVSGNFQIAPVATTLSSGLVVNLQDANGNPVSGVSVNWAVNGNATLTSSSTTSNTSGLASNTLTLGTVTGSYTVTATIQGTALSTTFTLTAIPGAINSFLLSSVPSTATAGGAFNFTVTAKDAFGNTKTDYTGAVSFTSSDPNSPLLPANYTYQPGDLGVKQFSSTLKTSGNQTITVTQVSGGAPTATTSSIAVSAGSATQLVFITDPSHTQAGQSVGNLLVRALDAEGNTATGYAGTVTLAIATNAGGGSLAGTLTGSASAGAITFSGISINKSGTGYTLRASGTGGVSSATTIPFTISSGTAASIAVSSGNNQSAVAGTSLGSLLVAVVQDSFGNAVSGVSVDWVTTSGTLGSASTTSNSSGLASNTLTTSTTAGSITVTASLPSTALSVNFTQTATNGDATQIVFTTQPTGAVAQGITLPTQPVLEIRDANNNKVTTGPDATADVTLSLSGGTGALGGTLTQAAVAGVATFSGISIDTQGAGKVITATKASTFLSGGTTSKTVSSNSFTINPPAPGAFAISSAVAGDSSVVLSWGTSSNVSTYSVRYGTTSGSYGTTFSTNATSPVTITGLSPGTTYYFMVTATNITGSTNATSEAVATPLSSFMLSATPGSSQVGLSWAASSGATTYTVKYGTSSGAYPTTFASGVTGTSSVVTGLTNGTPYYFMVTAQNSSGNLNASSEMAATPGQPTLSAVSDFTYGFSASDRYFDIPFTLGGLSSLTCAGNVGALTSNPAFITNSDLTISGTYPNCNLNIRVLGSATGSAVITLTATYGSATAVRTFNFTVTSIWSPANITTALWLDASDASSISLNGSTVSQWRDKSGNNRHVAQPTAAKQPTYTTAGQNGRNVLTFDGNQRSLFASSATVNIPQPFSRFFAGQFLVKNNASVVFDSEDANTQCLFYNGEVGSNWTVANGLVPAYANYAYGTRDFLNHQHFHIVNGSSSYWGLDGSSLTGPLNAGAGGQVGIRVGHVRTELSTKYAFQGRIFEMIYASGIMSASDRQKMEGYLAWKWGTVSNLPINHPYRWDGSLFGYGTLWTPASITTALWLDAADSNSITLNGSTVSQWNDKSGNNRHISQATASLQPAYTTEALNGYPGINFSSNKGLKASGLTSFTNAFTIAVVRSPTATWGGYHTILDRGDTGTRTGGIMSQGNSGIHFTPYPSAAWQNGTSTAVSTSCFTNITNANLLAFTPSTTAMTSLSVGNYEASTAGGAATQFETIALGTAPTVATRQLIEGYLAWKWGLVSNLPAAHPYKNAPPTL